MLIQSASWIRMDRAESTVVPVFRRTFPAGSAVRSAVLDTVHGRIRSFWKYTGQGIRYEIDTPVPAEIILGGKSRIVGKGRYLFGEAD